jgi:hypothetical protein
MRVISPLTSVGNLYDSADFPEEFDFASDIADEVISDAAV